MLITAYLVSVNALSFTMHAEDKAASNGLLPFLGRIPGMTESWSERSVWRNIVIEYFHAFGQEQSIYPGAIAVEDQLANEWGGCSLQIC